MNSYHPGRHSHVSNMSSVSLAIFLTQKESRFLQYFISVNGGMASESKSILLFTNLLILYPWSDLNFFSISITRKKRYDTWQVFLIGWREIWEQINELWLLVSDRLDWKYVGEKLNIPGRVLNPSLREQSGGKVHIKDDKDMYTHLIILLRFRLIECCESWFFQ